MFGKVVSFILSQTILWIFGMSFFVFVVVVIVNFNNVGYVSNFMVMLLSIAVMVDIILQMADCDWSIIDSGPVIGAFEFR